MLEALKLYGREAEVQMAIEQIQKTAQIHSRAEWTHDESPLGPGYAVIVLSPHVRLDVDIAADAHSVTVKE